jgi:hypothetical protein
MRYLLIVLTALPLLANAEEPSTHLGRLFFTPAERASLDVLRQNSRAPDKVIKADEISKDDEAKAVDSPPSAIRPVIMNGYISRSDGKNTLWVNDREVSEKSTSNALNIGRLNNNQVKIVVNKNKAANLKPGQVYDPNTGKIYNHASEAPQPVAEVLTPTDATSAQPDSPPAAVQNK